MRLSDTYSGSIIHGFGVWFKQGEVWRLQMNPIEQVWTYVRTQGFKNLAFQTLAAVEDRLCEIVNLITHEVIKSITGRQWIIDCFLEGN